MATMNDQMLTGNQFDTGSMLKKKDKLDKRIRDFDAVDILLVQIGDSVVGTTQVGFDLLVNREADNI